MAPPTMLARAPVSAAVRPVTASRSFLGRSLKCVAPVRHTNVAASRFVVMAAATEQVLKDVRAIIAEQLGSKLEEVQPESKFVDLGADSLDTVEIMMALEEKFELELDEEGAEKISTVQEAADLIAGQVKA